MGVQEMSRVGMEERDFDVLSGFIADVVIKNLKAKEEVKKFRQKFLKMKYCLSAEKALPFASKIIKSLFPSPEFSELFMENLEESLR